eukprot:9120399-Ditylum_brightwellii.AAC.1
MEFVEASDRALLVKEKCKDFFQAFLENEATAVICVFISDTFVDAIKLVDQLPTDISGLKRYFHNLYIPGKTTFIWPSVCLGFGCNMQSLTCDLATPL